MEPANPRSSSSNGLKVILIISIFPIIALVSYFVNTLPQKAKKAILFNPLYTTLNIKIDDRSYTVFPDQEEEIELTLGQHHAVSSTEGNVLVDTMISITVAHAQNSCLINLSKEAMYLVKLQYETFMFAKLYELQRDMPELPESSPNKKFIDSIRTENLKSELLQYNLFNINGEMIFAKAAEYPADHYVIAKDWYYGVNDAIEQQIESRKIYGEIKNKLFSKTNFLAYWKANDKDHLSEAEILLLDRLKKEYAEKEPRADAQ